MTTRVWFENDAIQMDGIGTVPARSLKTVIDGDRVHVLTLSDVRLSQLVYGEHARKDGSGFASAVAAKAYLDGEFARAVAGSPGATGPAGPAGPQGATGAKGDAGSQGVQGVAGATGSAGAKGDPGSAGSVGATGAQGAKGDTGAMGLAGTAGSTGPQGVTGPQGSTGPQGPAGFGTVTPSTPTRTLNTVFQPSATKAVEVSYSVGLSVTNPLLVGASTAQVQILSDVNNPPTTVRDTAAAGSTVGITVSLQLTTSNTIGLRYLVPAGHYVRLVSTVTGTGTTSIITQTEEALG